MPALPGSEWSPDPVPAGPTTIGAVRHVFTHFALELRIERGEQPIGQGWWHPLDRLADAGLPTLYRRAAELALGAAEQVKAAA